MESLKPRTALILYLIIFAAAIAGAYSYTILVINFVILSLAALVLNIADSI